MGNLKKTNANNLYKLLKISLILFLFSIVLIESKAYAGTARVMAPGPIDYDFTTCSDTVVAEIWDPEDTSNLRAYFWSNKDGQDDIWTYSLSRVDPEYSSGAWAGTNCYAVRIKFSDHGSFGEYYSVHIYEGDTLRLGITLKNDHSYSLDSTTAATCTTAGSKLYKCHLYGAVCSQSYTESIPALGHDYSSSWTTDTSDHWHKCTRCSSISSKGSHTSSGWKTSGTQHWKECTTCGYITSAKTNHTPSGWKTSGTQHWKECTTCGYITTAKANHTPSDWKTNSTQHWKECTTCGYITTAKANHTPSDWKTSGTQHWKECTTCAYITTAKGNHSDISNPKDGLCNTCNYRMYYMATVPSYEDKTYNGTTQSVSAGTGYTLSGQTSGKAVGSYTVTATLTNHSDGKPYKWSPDAATSTKSITWRILKRDITITALDQTTYYPTRITKTTAKVSGNNLCSGHSITSITLTETPSTTTYPTPNENGVGTGTITPSGATITSSTDGNVTSNYNIRYANGTWTLKDNTRPQGYLRANNPTAILIDGRMAYNIRNISLTMKATDDYAGVKEVYLFNENSIPSSVASISSWKNWATSSDLSHAGTNLKLINWTLSNGDGKKTVYLYIRDKAGNVSVTF